LGSGTIRPEECPGTGGSNGLAGGRFARTTTRALKSFAHGTVGVENAMAFDESLKPRFVLVVGVPGLSRAIQVAERLAWSAGLDRARELSCRRA
jgi:hypothetical protein